MLGVYVRYRVTEVNGFVNKEKEFLAWTSSSVLHGFTSLMFIMHSFPLGVINSSVFSVSILSTV